MIDDSQIIFLISQPRSGSTMLQAILGGHPDIHTCSEPWIALPFVYALKNDGIECEFHHRWSNDAIAAFFKESCIDETFYISLLNSFLSSLYQKALDPSEKTLFLDKTPRYYEIAFDLKKIFPTAKFIILYRHPLSVLNSIINTWVKDKTEELYYFSRDLLEAPRKMMDFVSKHEKDVCIVHYEKFVRSTKSELKRICEYLGVSYLEQIINYKPNTTWYFGDKTFREKSSPDYKSIEAWKNALNDKHILNFSYYYLKELGEELFVALGYQYTETLDLLEQRNPNQDDFNTWNSLLHRKHIVTIDEQKQHLKDLKTNISVDRGSLPAPSIASHNNDWPVYPAKGASVPELPPDESWPKISLVTPSFNQGDYLEKTIRSVLLQGYPNLEYIIIDGNSTDQSVEIIKKYAPWINFWISEKDRGQSHAINKGFAISTGELLGWLNSDDYLLPGALFTLAQAYLQDPSVGAVYGQGHIINEQGDIIYTPRLKEVTREGLFRWCFGHDFMQPSCLFTRQAWQNSGPIDESLDFALDVEYWIRIAEKFQFKRIENVLSISLSHTGAKTTSMRDKSHAELARICMRHGKKTCAQNILAQIPDRPAAQSGMPPDRCKRRSLIEAARDTMRKLTSPKNQ